MQEKEKEKNDENYLPLNNTEKEVDTSPILLVDTLEPSSISEENPLDAFFEDKDVLERKSQTQRLSEIKDRQTEKAIGKSTYIKLKEEVSLLTQKVSKLSDRLELMSWIGCICAVYLCSKYYNLSGAATQDFVITLVMSVMWMNNGLKLPNSRMKKQIKRAYDSFSEIN